MRIVESRTEDFDHQVKWSFTLGHDDKLHPVVITGDPDSLAPVKDVVLAVLEAVNVLLTKEEV